MMWSIARFELRKGFRRTSTYVYFCLFLSIAFLVVIAAGGAFPGASIVIGGSGGKTLINSPFVLSALISIISCFGLVVMAAVMGQAVYQDFHHQTHTLFFTAPISKLSYLGGRYLGSLLVLCFIFSSLGWGAFLGASMPFVEPNLFGPQRPYAYVHPYLITVLPNSIFIGAVFFSLAALTRKILPVYVASVMLLIGYLIAVTLVREIEWKLVAALADPFGISAFGSVTEYWTVAERNTRYIPLRGALLANRAIWLSVAAAIFGGTLWRFRFEHGSQLAKSGSLIAVQPMAASARSLPTIPTRHFQPLRLLPNSILLDFKETVKNVYFAAIVLAGVLFMVLAAQNLGSIYGTKTYPVTAIVAEIAGGSFSMFLLIILTFYAGELVWRERDANLHQLFDVLPIPTWFPLVSKTLALAGVQVVLMAVVMLCGMGIQASQRYFHFEPGVYFQDLFGFKLIQFVLLSVLAIAVHVVVNHKYVGHFVMVLYYLATTFMGRFGFEHHLYDYASTPVYTYSDMNGFGHFVTGVLWFDLYWAFAAVLLALVSNLLWVRGTDPAFSSRLAAARARLTRPVQLLMAATGLGLVGTGAFIYYNTNVLNTFKTSLQRQKESASYEQDFKKLEWVAQPRVTDVRVACDLFPEDRNLYLKGVLTLRNKTESPIPTVYVNVRPEATIRRLALGDADRPATSDAVLGFHTFTLSKPLEPGATLPLEFELAYEAKGFRNDADDTQVVRNGTFFNSQTLPHIGYDAGRELTDDSSRRKQKLPPRERMADVHDLRARGNNYISHDADWVTLDAVVSTSPDQIAIVPGYLQREWTESGRRYFHYRTEGRILNFFSVLSARYEVRRDQWRGKVAFGKGALDQESSSADGQSPNTVPDGEVSDDPFAGTDQDVSIEIYYHRGHEYNVDRMIEAIKASLDYFTVNFSPYQHRQVRIIEFPRYASFAQSFPNTIPYSESIGFIARVNPNDPNDIDYPYYVTAHEIGHQWWAHQVIGGNVRGSTMMSETFAQYSALMVMKHKYGADQMKRFLRYELDRYLIGRGTERKKELPLAFNENQAYIHYNKGSLVMYALQDYLGEKVINRALANYIRNVGYQEPPYTNSLDFIAELRQVTPPEMQYLIEDLFETITLFDNRAISARYAERTPGKYEVTVEVQAIKLRADEQGAESNQPLDDLIDVGVLDARGRPLALERKRIQSSPAKFEFTVEQLPAKAGIDPLNKLIDRRPNDNVIRVEKQ